MDTFHLMKESAFRSESEDRLPDVFIESWYNPSRRHSALGYKLLIN